MKLKSQPKLLSLIIAASCALAAMPSFAQESSAEEEKNELDEVIVTVERREQNLQEYAGTAQVLSPEDLRGLGINNDLRNIQVAIPGLNIANQEGNIEIYLRGVGSANNTELGDPANAPHINGAYIPRPRGLGGMFYDLERVEVNKGPQGTLRGRNALGGTLNIVTKRPTLGGGGESYVQAEVANQGGYGAEFGVDLGANDVVGLRLSGYKNEKDGSFKNVGDARLDPAGMQDDDGVRASLLVQPNEALSIFAMADFGRENGTGYPGFNLYNVSRAGFDFDEINVREIFYRGPQGDVENENKGFMTSITYGFDGFALEYNGSIRANDFAQTNASNEGPNWPGRNVGALDQDLFSSVYWSQTSDSIVHELRFFSDSDQAFAWSGGLFHFEEDQTTGFFSVADKGIFYSGTEFTMPDVRSKSSAAFFDGTFNSSDVFRIKGGLRYTQEDKYRYGVGGNWVLGLGSEGFGCCFSTRLGTEGFRPALVQRPNFDVSNLSGNNPAIAQFLLQGILQPGARDTVAAQLAGVIGGTRPNGTCIDRPDINGGSQDCPANGQHSFFSLGAPSQQIGSSKDNYLDWRLGFEYDVSDQSLFYATASSGHKSGGFNDSFDPAEIPETYGPESIVALEIGSKNAFEFGGRYAFFNVSGFFYNYSDQVFQDLTVIGRNPQTNEPSGYALVNRNIGKSRLYGVEAESLFTFANGFSLNLVGLYLNTDIREGSVADVRSQNFGEGGVTSTIDLSGNELPLSSKFTLNTRLQQVIDVENGAFDWQVLAAYRSSYFLSQFNERNVIFVDRLGAVQRTETAAQAGFPAKQSGEVTLNAGAGFTSSSGMYRFEIWGSNLLNKDISQKALVGSGLDVRFLNDARSYGARVRVNF